MLSYVRFPLRNIIQIEIGGIKSQAKIISDKCLL